MDAKKAFAGGNHYIVSVHAMFQLLYEIVFPRPDA